MIKVDTKDLERLVKELKLAHRSKYPNAVRFTLNDLAFDAKQNTIPKAFINQSGYTIRKPAFVKAFTTVKKATGYEVSTMYSQAGFSTDKAGSKGQKNAVSRMKQQDEGGSVKSEGIPLYASRRGSSHQKLIQNKNFWKNINVVAKIPYGEAQQLIKTVVKTGIKRAGGNKATGIIYGDYLYGIQGYKRIGRNTVVNLTRLYDVKEGRSVSLNAKHFMQKAANETGAKLDAIFTKNAERQLAKFK